jgi:transposase
MEWLKEKKCLKGVMESSGIYWVPIYVTLTDNGFQVTIANVHQVKAIPGRKTDELDSQWLARIFSAGLVKPSCIPEKKISSWSGLAPSNYQTAGKTKSGHITKKGNSG